MITSVFIFIQGFPKTINSKVDRKALIAGIKKLDRKSRTDKDMTETIDVNLQKTIEKFPYNYNRLLI